jgi:WD40 repeat protein
MVPWEPLGGGSGMSSTRDRQEGSGKLLSASCEWMSRVGIRRYLIVVVLSALPGCDEPVGAGGKKLESHEHEVSSVAFDPADRTLATSGWDSELVGEIIFWDVNSSKMLKTIKVQSKKEESVVAYSPDGESVASGGHDGTIRIWRVESAKEEGSLAGHRDWVLCLAYTPDSKYIISGSVDKSLRVWDVKKGEARFIMKDNKGWINAVAVAPDGTAIASGCGDGTVTVWEMETGKARHILTGHKSAVNAVAFAPDSKTLATGEEDGIVRIWDVSAGKEVTSWSCKTRTLLALAYCSKGKQLVVGGNIEGTEEELPGVAQVYIVENGKLVTTIRAHPKPVVSIAIAHGGKIMATCSSSKKMPVRLWDLETGKEYSAEKDKGSPD